MAPNRSRPGRAVVVGSGPNGLTAAALLAVAGWQVEVHEANATVGGAAASAHGLLGPGTIVDLGASGHPFGIASPAFTELGLTDHGLAWVHAPLPMAHPMTDRPAGLLHRGLAATVAGLEADGPAWQRLHAPLTRNIDAHLANLLGPMTRFPAHPVDMGRFGLRALAPASLTGQMLFADEATRALFAGSAAHAITPPGRPLTSAFGLLFGALGMTRGWPAARGGSQAIVDALVSVLTAHGSEIHTDAPVTDLRAFADADAVLLNLTPAQVLRLEGLDLSGAVRRRLGRWRYGTAAHKVDYLLDRPINWSDPAVADAGTVHVVGTVAELQEAEAQAAVGLMPNRPFVMVCQHQGADPSRGAADQHVVWTYAHVPNGYREPRTGFVAGLIEDQIERFAPGFTATIRQRVETSPAGLEAWNSNLIGGDVAGGAMSGLQSVLRPGLTLDPYRLRRRGLYLCSGATPPGGGVHGMPGYWAARAAIADQAAGHRAASPLTAGRTR